MNLFTISRQAATSDRRGSHGNPLTLRRFVGGLLAALTGVVLAFSAPSEAYAQCTNTPNGQWPSGAAFTPTCTGSAQNIATDVWTGEYSLVNVVSGTEYTFSSSVGTHFITIYGTDGTTVYASGSNPVVWTASLTGAVRFATHLSAACDFLNTNHTRAVACAASPPPATPGASCANPISVTAGSYTYPTIPAGNELSNICAAGGSTAIWYSFVAPADGSISVNSCGTLDTRVSVLSGACGSLSCVAWNDDSNQSFACQTGNLAAGVTTAVTSGVTYYIQWDNRWSSASADWNLVFAAGPVAGPCDAPNVVGALPVVSEPIACDGTDDFTSANVANVCGSTSYYGGQEALYSFTPATTGSYEISIAGQTWTGIMVYDACPLTGSCVGQIQNSASSKSLTVSLTGGVEYFILFDTYPAPNSPCPGTYSINEVVPPAVGECTNTSPFITATAPTTNVPLVLATNQWQSDYNTINGVVSGTTYVSDYQIGGSSNGWITVRSGTSSGPVVATGNAPLTWTATTSGTHFVHYNTSDACGTATTNGTSSIQCSSCPPPPPIAWCAAATTIGCNASASGTTVGASTTAIPATCVTTNGTGGKVAYIFTGIGEDVEANTFGSAFDTKLWVYEYNGDCQPGDLVCVTGNDDFGGAQSFVNFFGASGQDYLIVVGGFGAAQGAFTLNVLCGPFGCTDPAACNYDDTAANDDGSCFFICNDVPSGAIALATTPLGTCSPLAQDMNDATTNFGGLLFGFGNDLWYSFTAVTSGVRVEVSTSTVDAMVEVRDAATNSLVEFEDALFVNGSEILNFGGLTAGEDYLIRVADYNSGSTSRPFDICVQFLPDTQCDYPVGVTSTTRSLCQNAKADWVTGGTNYTFHFTPVGGGATITYETGAAFTIAPLQNVPGLVWGTTYEVEIDVALSLANGAGTAEAITVLSSGACELVISDAPVAALRAADNVTNAGPLPLGAYIAATPWVCTATEWEWVFSNTNGSQLPITHLSGAPGRFVRLSDVSGLNAGDVYNVQVRPVFATGYVGAFGATDQIAIIGALGMVDDVTSPVANTEIDERVEETIIEAGVALYPNPNRGDFVNVNIANIAEGVERVIFDLYDLTGKRVISQQIAVAGSGVNVVMPLNGLADGMYIANIIVGDEVHTERIAVQK